ncbi:unnamed protein product [Oreochromis niloticus]|nr:unnamed protein product [Mustela putorius furo]
MTTGSDEIIARGLCLLLRPHMPSRHPDTMKVAPLLVLLGVCVLLQSALTVSAVSLSVSPNLQQFFSGPSSVYLSCVVDGPTVDGWTVKRTRGGLTEDCGAAAGFGEFKSYTCIFSDISESDSAGYWCETSSGQRSDQINITVTEKHLILEVPALPVRTGSDVTLRCRQRNGDTVQGYFSIKGSSVGPKRQHSITNITQADEGLYWCSTDDGGKSPQSFLRVRDPHPPQNPSPSSPPVNSPLSFTLSIHPPASSPTPPSLLVLRLFCHLVVFCLYCISTGLLLSIYCSRKTRDKQPVSMEMTQRDGESQQLQPLDEECDDFTANITTEHAF